MIEILLAEILIRKLMEERSLSIRFIIIFQVLVLVMINYREDSIFGEVKVKSINLFAKDSI